MKFESMTMTYRLAAHEACRESKMPESLSLRSFAPMTTAAWNLTRGYLDGAAAPAAAEEPASTMEEAPAESTVLGAAA